MKLILSVIEVAGSTGMGITKYTNCDVVVIESEIIDANFSKRFVVSNDIMYELFLDSICLNIDAGCIIAEAMIVTSTPTKVKSAGQSRLRY